MNDISLMESLQPGEELTSEINDHGRRETPSANQEFGERDAGDPMGDENRGTGVVLADGGADHMRFRQTRQAIRKEFEPLESSLRVLGGQRDAFDDAAVALSAIASQPGLVDPAVAELVDQYAGTDFQIGEAAVFHHAGLKRAQQAERDEGVDPDGIECRQVASELANPTPRATPVGGPAQSQLCEPGDKRIGRRFEHGSGIPSWRNGAGRSRPTVREYPISGGMGQGGDEVVSDSWRVARGRLIARSSSRVNLAHEVFSTDH